MNKKFALLAAAGALVFGAVPAHAISGVLAFSTEGGTWTGDGGTVLTIEQINSFGNVEVDFGTGSFSGLGGLTVTMGEPLKFTAPTSIDNPFWSVGGFTFELLAITDIQRTDRPSPQLDTLGLAGTGLISDGIDTAFGSWVWSGDMSGTATFTFSSTTVATPTPDGGTTAMLLGMGFLGLGALARRKS